MRLRAVKEVSLNKTLKKIAVGAAALATIGGASFATSADARPHGGWHGRGAGVAIGAGLLGLAVGASLAHPYYGPRGYYGGPGYYYDGCRSYWRWSRHWGRYVRVERCY
jgi:hypothetical protein